MGAPRYRRSRRRGAVKIPLPLSLCQRERAKANFAVIMPRNPAETIKIAKDSPPMRWGMWCYLPMRGVCPSLTLSIPPRAAPGAVLRSTEKISAKLPALSGFKLRMGDAFMRIRVAFPRSALLSADGGRTHQSPSRCHGYPTFIMLTMITIRPRRSSVNMKFSCAEKMTAKRATKKILS